MGRAHRYRRGGQHRARLAGARLRVRLRGEPAGEPGIPHPGAAVRAGRHHGAGQIGAGEYRLHRFHRPLQGPDPGQRAGQCARSATCQPGPDRASAAAGLGRLVQPDHWLRRRQRRRPQCLQRQYPAGAGGQLPGRAEQQRAAGRGGVPGTGRGQTAEHRGDRRDRAPVRPARRVAADHSEPDQADGDRDHPAGRSGIGLLDGGPERGRAGRADFPGTAVLVRRRVRQRDRARPAAERLQPLQRAAGMGFPAGPRRGQCQPGGRTGRPAEPGRLPGRRAQDAGRGGQCRRRLRSQQPAVRLHHDRRRPRRAALAAVRQPHRARSHRRAARRPHGGREPAGRVRPDAGPRRRPAAAGAAGPGRGRRRGGSRRARSASPPRWR